MKLNKASTPNPEDSSQLPDYKRLDKSLARDRSNLQLFDKNQKKLFPPIVAPTIYAFSSTELDKKNKGRGAVKVGDTHQADYTVRLNQWGKEYGEINEVGHVDAFFDLANEGGVTERIYYRDYSFHKVLTSHYGQEPLNNQPYIMPKGFKRLSREFFIPKKGFQPISQQLLEKANRIIQEDCKKGTGLYKNYRQPPLGIRNPKNVSYTDEEPDTFDPYEYQRKATLELVNKFINKTESIYLDKQDEGEKRKVILDAPTRSGKSYMTCWALKALIQRTYNTYKEPTDKTPGSVFSDRGSSENEEATLTIITSGVPDIFDEFRRTIEKHRHFRKFFCWITKEQVLSNPNIIKEKQNEGYQHIILALSLQDLAGRKGDKSLKKIHECIKGIVSFVIGDECHFAMFSDAESYKAALQEMGGGMALDQEEKDAIDQEFKEGGKARFSLSPRYGYIFASATTYTVLDKNVFDQERDIVFVSPYEIQQETDEINKSYKTDHLKSPFFGRPQKHYFGIDIGCPASELFKANRDGEFIHASATKAVVESFYGIGKYENLPELFSNDVLQAAGAGRHMLWQMPSRNACDALEKMMRELGIGDDYHLLNISSKRQNSWDKKSVYAIKDEIRMRRFEKTITITVNRFITGVSIPEWDSVILANSGKGLTRRIQTYGRVETPWVEVIDNNDKESDDEAPTKYCQKPNCFVFDLNPEQLYEFCHQTELHANHLSNHPSERDKVVPGGNAFSFNGLKMNTMTRQDVNEQLDDYIKRRKIGELAARVDPMGEMKITEDLRASIDITSSGTGVKAQLNELGEEMARRSCINTKNSEEDPAPETEEDLIKNEISGDQDNLTEEKNKKRLELDDRQRREFIYKRLMLASIIMEEPGIKQLLTLLQSNTDYRRQASHMGFSQAMIQALTSACDNFTVADRLERAMRALSARANTQAGVYIDGETEGTCGDEEKIKDEKVQEGARTEAASAFLATIVDLKTLSDNQVLTPITTAEIMVDALDLDFNKVKEILGNNNPDFIDTGAKSGVLLLTVYRRVCEIIAEALQSKEVTKKQAERMASAIGSHLVAVPTSPITYEIIKKLYSIMNWDESNILWCEEAPGELKENWAYFIAQNTKFFIRVGELRGEYQKESMHKWLEENNFSDIINNKKEEKSFTLFLTDLIKIMNEKFDYTISNPPYQDSASGNKNRAKAIFPEFIDAGRAISDTSIMIHPARFLSNAGDTNKDWNKDTIESPEFEVVALYSNSNEVFDSVVIKGGVVITSFTQGKKDGGYEEVYISIPELRNIKDKISKAQPESFSEIVSASSPLKADKKGRFRKDGQSIEIKNNSFEWAPEYTDKDPKDGNHVRIWGIINNKRVYKYLHIKYLDQESLPKVKSYKVLVPMANGSGALGETLSTPIIGGPMIGSTEAFLFIGQFDNQDEAEHLLKYVKTKFARALLGIIKTTQHNSKGTWKYVPQQDFTKNSDIDWTKSVKEIDEQLYKKYELSKKEIKFMEYNIKEMQ